jgi:hypothetical protein
MPPTFDLPGPPTCCICGTSDAPQYVGGYGFHLCPDCIVTAELVDPVPGEASCVLCGLEIGERSPWLWRHAVVAAEGPRGIVLCARCRYTSLAILAEIHPAASAQ